MRSDMRYGDYIIKSGAPVDVALKSLEKNEYKALVLEDGGELRGVLTDGDVRRFLLGGGSLAQPVEAAATKQPSRVTGYNEKSARDILERLDCTVVPMVNKDNRLHALVFKGVTLHLERDEMDNPVIIMAGGLGTRLYPYTEILPKPLMPAGGVTITELIIGRFQKFGCKDFSLVVNHKKNLIKSYFSETDADYSLRFIDEDAPLGTGGGLAFFKGGLNRPAFVTYCDNVVEADYREILSLHERENNAVTMAVVRKSLKIPYGVIETSADGEITEIREKPEESYLINAGFYIVSPEFLDLVEDNKFQHITDLILKCKPAGLRAGTYQIDEDCFIDAGRLEDLKELGGRLR